MGQSSSLFVFKPMNQLRAAPNQLTLLRLCIVPFLVWPFSTATFAQRLRSSCSPASRTASMVCWPDGCSSEHVLGQYLDPVADKLLLSTLFLVLHHEGLISRRVTVLVFGRDLGIVMVAAILYASVGMRDFKPSIFGKANTLAQRIALLAVLLSQFYAPAPVLAVRHFALLATIGFTVISGFHYAWQITRRLSFSGTPANG